MAMALPPFEKFAVFTDESSAGIRWGKWLAKFENLLCALDIKTDKRKKALLLHYCGDEVYDIYHAFTAEQKGEGAKIRVAEVDVANEYPVLKQSLTNYFNPKKNSAYEVFNFRHTTQLEGESIDTYYTRLRTLAATCEFQAENIDKEILMQILHGCKSQRLRRRALRDNFNLEKVLAEARSYELSEKQATEIESGTTVNAVDTGYRQKPDSVRFKTKQSGGNNRVRTNTQHRNESQQTSTNNNKGHRNQKAQNRGNKHGGNRDRNTQCRNCGGTFPHVPRGSCPARGSKCHKCDKYNHFARCCLSTQNVRQIADLDCEQNSDQENADSATSSDESVFSVANKHSTKTPTVETHILDKPVRFLVDTGATVNIINNDTYTKVCAEQKLRGPSPLIYAYGSKTPLPVKGYLSTDIVYTKTQNRVNAKLYVVENNANNLLSADTAQALGLIHFAFASSLSVPKPINDEFSTLFDGKMGKIKGKKVHLHIDQSITPVTQRHRRVPFHVRKDVETELERLENMDIIEKVEGPTPWISAVVVVPKKSGAVRLCIDMRQANKAIKREKHPIPTLDDLISDLNGSTVFSKLDLTNGYHQLELDESSRYITTFTTHVGLRRYKRLLFGVNAASEIFQNAIAELLSNIPGAKNISDDVIVHGKTQEDHDASLNATLRKLEESGAKLNKEKCIFSVKELTFYGHVFGERGMSADPEKIKTIVNSPAPSNVSEVRSFLGMTQYVSRFIPGYATLTETLRNLTKKDTPWQWSDSEQKAFDTLKESLTGTRVMSYFDPAEKTEILVDASPVGLGALMTQKGKVICYASRALTPVEQRYSQTDREMLAVVYGVEHFHLYLYGASFTVVTDHKPLLGIMKSPKPTTARIERWRLRLMPYDMTLKYSPGRDDLNPADYISRHPQTLPERENAGEVYVNYICENAVPKAMTLEEVQIATQQDDILQKVISAVQTDRWHDIDLKQFQQFRDELSVTNGVVVRDHRLVIPVSLQQKVVEIAHQSHQGIVKTKQLIREKVWFPGIDRQVEEAVKSCIPCMASYPGSTPREPINPTPLPSAPWVDVAMDFAGPFPSGDYVLVMVDEYSRYPEVEVVSSTASRSVLPKLEAIFARQGIPKTVKTDNGPPFNGREFSDFAAKQGFRHRKVTPLWPEANGEAERFMATLNKSVRSSVAAGRNWKSELPLFLRQYRATPHASTKISPFEVLTGRKMNIGLPEVPYQIGREPVRARVMKNDAISKQNMKVYADNRRHTKLSPLGPGDQVLVKQRKLDKLTPPFDPRPCTVLEKKGSMVTARQGKSVITRNSTYFRRLRGDHQITLENEERDDPEEINPRPPLLLPYDPPSPARSLPTVYNSPRSTQSNTPCKSTRNAPSPVRAESSHTNITMSRPVREKKSPTYLKDYVLN